MRDIENDVTVMEFDLLDALDALAAAIVMEEEAEEAFDNDERGSTVHLCLADIRDARLNEDDACFALERIKELFGENVRLQYQAIYEQVIDRLQQLVLPEGGGDG